MRIVEWDQLAEPERRAALARPAQQSRAEVAAQVLEIISTVRHQGDAALRSYTERFDGVQLEALAVPRSEFIQARRSLAARQIAALECAIANVHEFHSAQVMQPLALETMPGVRCERIIRPISAVGLYVPAGSAPLPSTVVMLAVPARIAGCARRILCTAPTPEGRANPAVLVAAELCGIEAVFKVGGAQAIAALAYGTASVPKVDKIFGPGNAWVTAAKQLVADEPARPDFVAADLLAQAEHDAQAQALLLTPSRTLAHGTAAAIQTQLRALSRRAILEESLAASRCIVVPDLDIAMQLANQYAAEHLILEVREPHRWLPQIHNAGSIFLGSWSPEPLGDYCSGTNHVLPTYGYARAYSGLSVLDFVKRITVQQLSPAGLRSLGPVAVTLPQLEGLDAHAP